MQVTHTHCAGIDVQKQTVVVCCLSEAGNSRLKRETRTYGTMTSELLRMSEWVASEGITHRAIGLDWGGLATRGQRAGEQLRRDGGELASL